LIRYRHFSASRLIYQLRLRGKW